MFLIFCAIGHVVVVIFVEIELEVEVEGVEQVKMAVVERYGGATERSARRSLGRALG